MSLRKIGLYVLAGVVLAAGGLLYSQNQHTNTPGASTTYKSFPVQRTTVISENAGTLTLHYSTTLRVVLAVSASTDKGYFSLKCVGRSQLVSVPGNARNKAISCRLAEVHYSDSSASTGLVVWRPKH